MTGDEWFDAVMFDAVIEQVNDDAPKVYCGSCVYRFRDGASKNLCVHPATRTWQDTPLRRVALYPFCDDKNADLDCTDYDDSLWAELRVLWRENPEKILCGGLAILSVLACVLVVLFR